MSRRCTPLIKIQIYLYFNAFFLSAEQNTFGRFIGVCNSADSLVTRCLHEERIKNRSANRAKAVEKQNQYKERLRAQQQPQ